MQQDVGGDIQQGKWNFFQMLQIPDFAFDFYFYRKSKGKFVRASPHFPCCDGKHPGV